MPDTRYNTLEQIDNKFGETIKNGDTVPFLEVCVSHRRHFRQRNSEHRTALSLSIYLIALSLSLPPSLSVLRNVLHQHCHWRGWPLIIPFHSVPIVNPGKVQGATRDLRILSTAINKKLPAAGDGLDSKYGVVCTSVKINWTTVRVNRITAPRNERDCPTKRINEYLKAISLGLVPL